MQQKVRDKILAILDQHRVMRIATLRPDGWPQTTTVGYANDDLTLYFLCGAESQKAANLARDNRVSLAIDDDTPQVMEITGVSMAAHAEPVTDPGQIRNVMQLLMTRYPAQIGAVPEMPNPGDIRIFRVEPMVISLLDYAKGFAHTDLVTCP